MVSSVKTRASVSAARLAALVAGVAGVATAGCAHAPRVACSADRARSHVVVDTGRHELTLCEAQGTAARTFSVRLGHEGVGKSREGDGKTPLGDYPLGPAVRSEAYGLFLPIGYPTPAQRRAGLTGSAIGVHGPARGARWAGPLVNLFDTTDGCVGIATDDEMTVIAEFVRQRGVREIHIE